MIRQGELYWLEVGTPVGSGPGFRHPHLVIQSDDFNASSLKTVVVCTLTSKLKRGEAPGNVRLEAGEANLPRASVVNVTQLLTVDKDELGEKIGSLSEVRLRQVLAGVDRVLAPRRWARPHPES